MSTHIELSVGGLLAGTREFEADPNGATRQVMFRLSFDGGNPFEVRMDVDGHEGWVFDRSLLRSGLFTAPGSHLVHGDGEVRVGRTLTGVAFQLRAGRDDEHIAVLDPTPLTTFLCAIDAAKTEAYDVDSWINEALS